MAEQLTQLERRVYHYMIDFLAQNTYQPSIREIARKFRIKSTKTVSDLLHALALKGYIERDESRSRGVRLLGFASAGATQPVPYYGRIHAGDPALLPEHRVGYVTLDRRYLPGENCFVLKVKGDSMNGRHICDGDLVLLSPSSAAKDGDIVAVRTGGGHDAALKTFSSRENPSVLGVVCGVFRPLFEQEPVREFDDLPAGQQIH